MTKLMNNSIAVHTKRLTCYKILSTTPLSRNRITVETSEGKRIRISARMLLTLKDGIQHIKSSF